MANVFTFAFLFAPFPLRFPFSFSLSLSGRLSPLSHHPSQGSLSSCLLAEHDAVVVAASTLASSNPSLLSSEPGARQPLRVILTPSLAALPPEAAVFASSSLVPTLVITDEAAVLAEVTASTLGSGPDAESWLRAMGCELVALANGFGPDQVVDLLKQRNVHSVLWDWGSGGAAAAADADSVPELLAPWLLAEQAVHKLVVSVTGGGTGTWKELSLLPVKEMVCYNKGGEVVIEAVL